MDEKEKMNDIPILTEEQIKHIQENQSKADDLVSDSKSSYYEKDESKRRIKAREIMRQWERER